MSDPSTAALPPERVTQAAALPPERVTQAAALPPERVTQAEFARVMGVSRPYIHKLVSRGVIALDEQGLLDPAAALESIAAASRPGDQLARASESDTEAMKAMRAIALGDDKAPTAEDDAEPEDGKLAGTTSYQKARIEREIQMGRQARERADQIAMQNAIRRGEMAPVHVLEQILTRAATRIAAIFDAIPGAIKRRVPALGAQDIAYIEQEIAQARNIAASMALADLDDEEPAPASEPEPKMEQG